MAEYKVIKIVHIIIGLNVGGAELMLKRLVLHSSAKGEFEHCVISLTDIGVIGQQLQDSGIEVYSVNMNSFISVSTAFVRLRKMLKKINPDVVQTWMYHADFLGGLVAKSLGIRKIIWGIRTTDVSQGASSMTVHLSKLCAKLSYYIPNVIVCAAKVSKEYHSGIGYDASKMVVIPNGYNVEALTATKQDGLALRKEVGLSNNDIVIGSIGRFNPVKNQKLFVDMADKVIKQRPCVKFMIVGRDNVESNSELMSWINTHGISDSFTLLGQRNDIPQCLKAMDIFCLHSKTEGFPNVLVEAMISGTFVVASRVGEVPYLIPDSNIAEVEAGSFARKIIDILDSKDIEKQNIISSLKKDSMLKYSLEKIVLKYEILYKS